MQDQRTDMTNRIPTARQQSQIYEKTNGKMTNS